MANCESYLLGSIQISTICFPFSNNFNALPRSTMQARANDVLMMSNRPLLRSVSACALPFQHAWRCHLCQAKIRGNSRKCVLHWALRLTASASYTGVLLYSHLLKRHDSLLEHTIQVFCKHYQAWYCIQFAFIIFKRNVITQFAILVWIWLSSSSFCENELQQ